MKARFLFLVLAITSIPVLMGMSSSPRLRDIRFSVSSVTLTGPESIQNGRSANYTLSAVIVRDGVALNAVIQGTQGPPPPGIRPSIMSGSKQISRVDIDIPANRNTITSQLTLSCVDNEVRGALGGTGAGGKFLWWDSPAEVRGRLNERDATSSLKILCRDN